MNEVKLPTFDRKKLRVGRATMYTGDLFTINSIQPVAPVQGRVRIASGPVWSDLRLEDTSGPAILDRLLMGEDVSATVPLVNDRDNTLPEKISPMQRRGWGSSSTEEPPTEGCAIIPAFEIGGGLKTIQGAWHRDAGFGVLASPATTVVVGAAGAALNAISVPVAALTAPIPAGTYLYFLPGTGKLVRTTTLAAALAVSIAVEPIPVALVSGDTAYVSGADAAPKHAVFLWEATFSYDGQEYGNEDGGRQIIPVTAQAQQSFEDFVPEGMKLGYQGDPVQAGFPADKFFFSAPT